MDSGIIPDTACLFEIPKSKRFLFFPVTLKEKQTHPACFYITSIQTQHYHNLKGMFDQRFCCLMSKFRSNHCCMAISIPRIIGAALAYIGFISSFPWRPTCFKGCCLEGSEPAKYKIKKKLKCQYKLHLFLWG